ncbi:hypothetical protein FCV25MIE_06492 [Fagus crenata]
MSFNWVTWVMQLQHKLTGEGLVNDGPVDGLQLLHSWLRIATILPAPVQTAKDKTTSPCCSAVSPTSAEIFVLSAATYVM